jgi:hypothetical protein
VAFSGLIVMSFSNHGGGRGVAPLRQVRLTSDDVRVLYFLLFLTKKNMNSERDFCFFLMKKNLDSERDCDLNLVLHT